VSGTKYVGGIAGYVIGSSVTNNCATGDVTGTGECVGGVVGIVDNYTANCIVASCYATGAVSGKDKVGGIAGAIESHEPSSISSVTNCAALNPSVTATDIGGSAGRAAGFAVNTAVLLNNVAFEDMTVTAGGEDKTLDRGMNTIDGADTGKAALQSAAGFPSALTAEPWDYAPGNLPGLNGPVPMPAQLRLSGFFRGAGSRESPFEISTPAELAKLAELVNGADTNATYGAGGVHYRLMNDLDLRQYVTDEYGNYTNGWISIGKYSSASSQSAPFRGVFDGDGHVITGLCINDGTSDYAGLFGYVKGADADNPAEIKNLSVDADISAGNFVGGAAGCIEYGVITNCRVTGAVSGVSFIGGVAGAVAGGGSIANSYATGAVSGTGNNVGGIAGSVVGSVKNCYATGAVRGNDNVGGIAGLVDGGRVENCVALNPSVTGAGANAGRAAGTCADGTLKNNAAFSDMRVKTSGGAKSIVEGQGEAAKTGDGRGVNAFDTVAAGLRLYTAMPHEPLEYGFASPAFWTASETAKPAGVGWSGEIWHFEENRLPVLKGFGGSDGIGGQTGDAGLYNSGRDIRFAAVSFPRGGPLYTGNPAFIDDLALVGFGNETLRLGEDYFWGDYSNNIKSGYGTAMATLFGMGNYKGDQRVSFDILAPVVAERAFGGGNINIIKTMNSVENEENADKNAENEIDEGENAENETGNSGERAKDAAAVAGETGAGEANAGGEASEAAAVSEDKDENDVRRDPNVPPALAFGGGPAGGEEREAGAISERPGAGGEGSGDAAPSEGEKDDSPAASGRPFGAGPALALAALLLAGAGLTLFTRIRRRG
jgi:hypothetical protein